MSKWEYDVERASSTLKIGRSQKRKERDEQIFPGRGKRSISGCVEPRDGEKVRCKVKRSATLWDSRRSRDIAPSFQITKKLGLQRRTT